MIISASRRTDIPRFYFDWFINRLRAGFALVRNPMNYHQVSRVPLNPEVVDCIVFWTKDPSPMLDRLAELAPCPFYVQFTITPYGNDIESGLPPKSKLIDTFIKLSEKIGPEKTVWRYSPVLFSEKYTAEYHLEAFEKIAATLHAHTLQCKLSFIDIYKKIRRRMGTMGITGGNVKENIALARRFAEIGKKHGIEVSACGNIDYEAAGIPPAKCIDDALVSRITGYACKLKKDPGQRTDCYCVESVDIGAYDTCANGCQYCYANFSSETVKRNLAHYDPQSPMLCSPSSPVDKITDRKVHTNRTMQRSIFDIENE